MSEAKSKGLYKKLSFSRGSGQGVTLPGKDNKKIVGARHNLPGSVILVHGVNDVGVSYDAVESGLCEGLTERLCGALTPARYRMPQAADRHRLEEDPDAVFFKRQITDETHSPVIPFYWGFREQSAHAKDWRKTPHGQATDRYGNRLDRDFSKEGGPFANATTSLPDMWNRGKDDLHGMLDAASHDPTHPMLKNPGRLYMILAARRLAALISMIRDYDEDETVSIVAHSQGCLISLLAQAFLLDPAMKKDQPGVRPADTLILCNPPYSLIDEMPRTAAIADRYAGEDPLMSKGMDRYRFINGGQTLHARLTTLANIVKGVHAAAHKAPVLAELTDTKKHFGAVGPKWEAAKDRDNRGKVYLYFSPEDMTVAFAGVEGIGWQGVPDIQRGHCWKSYQIEESASIDNFAPPRVKTITKLIPTTRRPLEELGNGFFQRIFTSKRRPDFRNGRPVLVGQPPHDFALRATDEDDQGHTAASDSASSYFLRKHLPERDDAPGDASADEQARFGLRRITGEALPKPVVASMGEGAFPDAQRRFGASENVDQIDAAVSVTSDYGIDGHHWECISDPIGCVATLRDYQPLPSPRPALYKDRVAELNVQRAALTEKLNLEKKKEDMCEVKNVYVCLNIGFNRPLEPSKLLIERTETANEARLRWQKAATPRSFHSSIYGGRKNHSQVTAYDVAIGGGKAPTDPLFYQYLCAVADWRLKELKSDDKPRPGILMWDEFRKRFSAYWADERTWRKALIEGTKDYYSSGKLPLDLPLPPEGLPSVLVVESKTATLAKSEKATR